MSTSRDQRRRARELEAAMRELDRLDRAHGLGTMPTAANTRRKPRVSPVVLGVAVTLILLVSAILVSPSDDIRAIRRAIGLGPTHVVNLDYKPGEGEFRFMQTQLGSSDPVGYDPCRPIAYQVNLEGAPSDWRALITTAISDTHRASSLDFDYQGTTNAEPFDQSRISRTGIDLPVVIGFGDSTQFPELAGNVAGVGGSAVKGTMEGLYYRTGSIVLDSATFTESGPGESREPLIAVIDHELGHVVGLAHVASKGELMNAEPTRTTYGPGDLEGLARLGHVPCL